MLKENRSLLKMLLEVKTKIIQHSQRVGVKKVLHAQSFKNSISFVSLSSSLQPYKRTPANISKAASFFLMKSYKRCTICSYYNNHNVSYPLSNIAFRIFHLASVLNPKSTAQNRNRVFNQISQATRQEIANYTENQPTVDK